MILIHKSMCCSRLILVALLFVATVAKVSITNLPHDFTPKDERDYVNYLKLFMGNHQQSTVLSSELLQIASQHRPSFFNAVSKVIIVLVPQEEKETHSKSLVNMVGNTLQKLVMQAPENFDVKILSSNVQSQIKSLENEGAFVHLISGKQGEITRLSKLFDADQYAKTKAQLARRLSQKQAIAQTTTDSSYLIKFFFSLLFVFVIIAIVSFISSNQGKKDTLLYAKFIADVSNSR